MAYVQMANLVENTTYGSEVTNDERLMYTYPKILCTDSLERSPKRSTIYTNVLNFQIFDRWLVVALTLPREYDPRKVPNIPEAYFLDIA